MTAQLPNLVLLEYQATQIISKNETAVAKIKEHYKDYKCFSNNVPICLQCTMFMQTWSSTVTAFDVDADNCPTWGGCAITDAYTTVFFEPISSTYIIFIDNKLCYQVDTPTEEFLNDLSCHKLKSLSEAKKIY